MPPLTGEGAKDTDPVTPADWHGAPIEVEEVEADNVAPPKKAVEPPIPIEDVKEYDPQLVPIRVGGKILMARYKGKK